MIPSEKGKGAGKPTVNFMQGQLLVRRLHNGLKKGGQCQPNQTKRFSEIFVTKKAKKEIESEKKKRGLKA